MQLKKRLGLTGIAVVVAVLAIAGLGRTRSAYADGPYYGPYYQPVCVQTQTVYNWRYQWTGYGFQWVQVPATVCVQYASFNYPGFYYSGYYPYTYYYQQSFYPTVNSCLRPLYGGGYYNACQYRGYPYNQVGYFYP